MLIKPTPYDLRDIQEHGLKPHEFDPDDYLRLVSKTFTAFQNKDVYENVISYIHGFDITYNYLTPPQNDSIDEDTINTLTNGDKHFFMIQPGGCIIDNQLISFTDSILFSFDEITDIDNTEYSIIISYKFIDQYNEEFAKIQFVPTNILTNSATPTTPTTPDGFPYLEIGTFSIKNNEPYANNTKALYPENFNKLTLQEQQQYIQINDLYYARGINHQNLNTLYQQNFKGLFKNLKDNFLETANQLGLNNSNYINIEFDKIEDNLLSGTFVRFDYEEKIYKACISTKNKKDDVVGLYLYNKITNIHYIYTSGYVKITDEFNINQKILVNLIPGNFYYLEDNTNYLTIDDLINKDIEGNDPDTYKNYAGLITDTFYNGSTQVGYAISNNEIIINISQSSEFDTLEIMQFFGNSFDFNINAEYVKTMGLDISIDLLKQRRNEIRSLIDTYEEKINDRNKVEFENLLNLLDVIKFDTYNDFILLEDTPKEFYNLILQLLKYQLQSGIFDSKFKDSFFNNPEVVDSSILSNLDMLENISDVDINSIASNTRIIGVNDNSYEKIIFNTNNAIEPNKELNRGNFYTSIEKAGDRNRITYKIVLEYMVDADLKFYLDDDEIDFILVPRGNNTGIANRSSTLNDIYVNSNTFTCNIINIVGNDAPFIIMDNKSVFIKEQDELDITYLDIDVNTSKKIVTHKLEVKVYPTAENDYITGSISLLDHRDKPIKISDIIGSDTDPLTKEKGFIRIVLYNEEINDTCTIDHFYDNFETSFIFGLPLPNDIFINDNYIDVVIKSIDGYNISYTPDSENISFKNINSNDETFLKQEIIDTTNTEETILFSLTNSNTENFHIYLVNGSHYIIPAGETELSITIPKSTYNSSEKYRIIDTKNTGAYGNSNFEVLKFDYTNLINHYGISNEISFKVNNALEGNEVNISASSKYIPSTAITINVEIFKDEVSIGTSLLYIPSYNNNGITNISSLFGTDIAEDFYKDSSLYRIEFLSVNSKGGYNNVIFTGDTIQYLSIEDTIDTTYVYNENYINIDDSIYYNIYFSNALETDYQIIIDNYGKLEVYTLDAGSDTFNLLCQNIEHILENNFDIDGISIKSILPLNDNSLIFENLEIVNNFSDIPDINIVIQDNSIRRYFDINTFLYVDDIKLKLSNEPRETFTVTLGNLQKNKLIDINIEPGNTNNYKVNESYAVLDELYLINIIGGGFEFLEITNNLQMQSDDLDALGIDKLTEFNISYDTVYNTDSESLGSCYLSVSSDGMITEDESISYKFILSRPIPNDLTITMLNGEVINIRSGLTEATIKSNKSNSISAYGEDNIKNNLVVENYITSISGNKYIDIIILNDKTNPINTLIMDTIDPITLNLETLVEEDKIIYEVILSEVALEDTIVILNNGEEITINKNTKSSKIILNLEKHKIIALQNLFNISFEELFSNTRYLLDLVQKIIPTNKILSNYFDTTPIIDLETLSTSYINDMYESDESNIINIDNLFSESNEFFNHQEFYNGTKKLFETGYETLYNLNNFYITCINNLTNNYNKLNIEISELIQIKQNYIENITDLSDNNESGNISGEFFRLSNYQRNVFNYEYLTNRLSFYYKRLDESKLDLNTIDNDIIKNKSNGDDITKLLQRKDVVNNEINSYSNIIKNDIKEYNTYRIKYGKAEILFDQRDFEI